MSAHLVPCPVCGRSFLVGRGLSKHLACVHAHPALPTICGRCGRYFKGDNGLAIHQSVKHGKDAPSKYVVRLLACGSCSYCADTAVDMERHTVVHHQRHASRSERTPLQEAVA